MTWFRNKAASISALELSIIAFCFISSHYNDTEFYYQHTKENNTKSGWIWGIFRPIWLMTAMSYLECVAWTRLWVQVESNKCRNVDILDTRLKSRISRVSVVLKCVEFMLACLLCLLPGVCAEETPRWWIPQEDGRNVRVCVVHCKLIQSETDAPSGQLLLKMLPFLQAGWYFADVHIKADACCFRTYLLKAKVWPSKRMLSPQAIYDACQVRDRHFNL